MKKLTEKQENVFRFICEQQQNRGYPPTIREIGDKFNLRSTGSVRDYLNALEKKGFINRNSRTSRGIEILKGNSTIKARRIPLLGDIAAGNPIVADEQHEEEVMVDNDWFEGQSEIFALNIKGESMRDAGIMGGDVVFVQRQNHAENGEIVVALMEDEATVKYFYHEGNRIRLQPANDEMEPFYIEKEKIGLHIAGKVVGMMRKY